MNKVELFLKIPKKTREKFFPIVNIIKNPLIIFKVLKLRKIARNCNYNDWGMYNKEKEIWNKKFRKLALSTPDGLEEAIGFYNDEIERIKIDKEYQKVIGICLVKNDLERVKCLVKHYEKLGIKKIAFIDNDSDDGTFEFLKSCNSADLFRIKKKYSTIKRQSWINRVISYYGHNRWFLIVDSDEFLIYNDCDKHDINELICYYENMGINRARALMIDMYAQNFMMDKIINLSFIDVFKFFDKDTYQQCKNKYFNNIVGGMRGRVFGENEGNFYLVKYPLLYMTKETIHYNSHFSYPFYENFNNDLSLGLLHYKFMPNDLEKIKENVNNLNFANGSKEYKKYLQLYKNNPQFNFKYSGTLVLEKLNDIYKIDLLSEIKWNKR